MKDTSGDEADNMDETLVPVDYKSSGQITDDVILKEVRSPLLVFGCWLFRMHASRRSCVYSLCFFLADF